MKRAFGPTLFGIIGIAGLLTILVALPVGKIYAAIPTIKVPGAYPYEETVHIPAPTAPESPVLPAPAPFPYPDSLSPAAVSNSQAGGARRSLTAKSVRKAVFKYNGVANFWGFLAALPADVGVLDPKLGTTRPLVKGGRVIRKNVTWLRKRKEERAEQETEKPNVRLSSKKSAAPNSGI